MIRSAVLVSGKGTKLQSLLDSVFFGEIPELQLVAVISSDANAYALKRARNAGIETVVVEPAMFPNDTSYDMAIRNKLKDMDIELVINAGFYPGVGRETAKSFRNKVIAVQPSLVPAFETLRGDAVHEAVLARGLKVTGATAYLVDETGGVGPVLLQKAVPVLEDDDVTTLKRRVLTDAEWKLLPEAVKRFCAGKIRLHGGRIFPAQKHLTASGRSFHSASVSTRRLSVVRSSSASTGTAFCSSTGPIPPFSSAR